jgi:hypothetical protein
MRPFASIGYLDRFGFGGRLPVQPLKGIKRFGVQSAEREAVDLCGRS